MIELGCSSFPTAIGSTISLPVPVGCLYTLPPGFPLKEGQLNPKQKREAVSKRTRFEVFKRDKFRCQYCGSAAPDVLLHVDHIKPVADGGKSNILNLITACDGCNLGKSNVLLSDDTAVLKSRRQAEQLQERREQLELLMQWHDGLRDLEIEKTKTLAIFIANLIPGYRLSQTGMDRLSSLLSTYTAEEVFSAYRQSCNKYLRRNDAGELLAESVETATSKAGAFCKMNREAVEDPDIKDLYYVRGIIRKRLEGRYFVPHMALQWIQAARSYGASIESLKHAAKQATSYSSFGNLIDNLIEDCKRTNR